MSVFEAIFAILFLAAVFFNFRSPKVPLYCLFGFVIAAHTPEYATDAKGHYLGASGMMLTIALILWNWVRDLVAAAQNSGFHQDKTEL